VLSMGVRLRQCYNQPLSSFARKVENLVDSAVILAFSGASRHSQLTYNRSHVMLPVLGKPMVVRIMDRVYRGGIRNYIVVVGEAEGAVAAYLNTSWMPDVKIEFVLQPMGESVAKTLSEIARQHQRPFLITAYNSFAHAHFPERLLNRYKEVGDSLVLSAAPVSLSKATVRHFASLEDQRVVAITDRPGDQVAILSDMAVCGQAFVDYLAALPSNVMSTLANPIMDLLRVYTQTGEPVFLAETAWLLPVILDSDLLTLNRHLLAEEQDAHILSELPGTVRIIPPVRIDPQVSVGQGATIGPYAYLESGCSVGPRSTVHHAMVLEKAVVPAGESVSNVIISSRSRIAV
jgi:NDP-sugar pyrophosphorylase family protein